MSRMFNPPHPGATLREDVLPALGLTVTQAAQQLGVTRSALSRVLNEHAAVSPEMALRIEAWLGIERGGRADVWLAGQTAYDLWQARQKAPPMSSMRRSKNMPQCESSKRQDAVPGRGRSASTAPTRVVHGVVSRTKALVSSGRCWPNADVSNGTDGHVTLAL